MSNELISILILLTTFGGVLGAFYLGHLYLIGFLVTCLLVGNIITIKIGIVFGIAITPSTFVMASIALGTDVLAERYGRQMAHRSVFVGFFAILLFIAVTQLSVLLTPTEYAQAQSGQLDAVFAGSPRIFFASVASYLVFQNWDVWFYDKINQFTGGKWLWLRNNLSTATTQIGGSLMFFCLAFYGTPVPWLDLAGASIAIFLFIALLDTPFMYLSKLITPRDCRDTSAAMESSP